jgi:hypothetical protein
MPQKLSVRWSRQPWHTRKNKIIAERLGCSVATVWLMRRIYAPETCKKKLPEGFDWGKRDEDIAKDHGVSTATVAKARRAANAPPQPRKPGSGRTLKINYAAYDPRFTRQANAEAMGCKPSYVWRAIRRIKEMEAAKNSSNP